MNQIIGVGGAIQIIWNKVGENKWMETMIHRLADESGDPDWIVTSVTKYLKTEDIDAFIALGNELGWTFVRN